MRTTPLLRQKKTLTKKIMKNLILTLIGLSMILMLTSCKEEPNVDPAMVANLSIASGVNGATYDIKVALPANYSTSSEKYAVIYVLDGEENFNLVSNQCKEISNEHDVSNVLVVSIGYGNDRNLDYTPTKTGDGTGGAPLFLKFIKEELIPRMEKDFRADTTRSHRVILGHSYGGLFGAYAFGAHNDLFGNYILLSPSLWYDNEVTMLMERDHRNANKNRQQLVFMGIGEMENAGRMQAPFDGFYKTLNESYSNVSIGKNREKDLDHVGSKNPNIRKGLDFYFLNR
jgi:predicted alpha/beta superfamily hydrolase